MHTHLVRCIHPQSTTKTTPPSHKKKTVTKKKFFSCHRLSLQMLSLHLKSGSAADFPDAPPRFENAPIKFNNPEDNPYVQWMTDVMGGWRNDKPLPVCASHPYNVPKEKFYDDLWGAFDGVPAESARWMVEGLLDLGGFYLDIFPIKDSVEEARQLFPSIRVKRGEVKFTNYRYGTHVLQPQGRRNPGRLNTRRQFEQTAYFEHNQTAFQVPMDFMEDSLKRQSYKTFVDQANLNIHATWAYNVAVTTVRQAVVFFNEDLTERYPLSRADFEDRLGRQQILTFALQKQVGWESVESAAYDLMAARGVEPTMAITTQGSLRFMRIIRREPRTYMERGREIYPSDKAKNTDPYGDARTSLKNMPLFESRRFPLDDTTGTTHDPTVMAKTVSQRYTQLACPKSLAFSKDYHSDMRTIEVVDANRRRWQPITLETALHSSGLGVDPRGFGDGGGGYGGEVNQQLLDQLFGNVAGTLTLGAAWKQQGYHRQFVDFLRARFSGNSSIGEDIVRGFGESEAKGKSNAEQASAALESAFANMSMSATEVANMLKSFVEDPDANSGESLFKSVAEGLPTKPGLPVFCIPFEKMIGSVPYVDALFRAGHMRPYEAYNILNSGKPGVVFPVSLTTDGLAYLKESLNGSPDSTMENWWTGGNAIANERNAMVSSLEIFAIITHVVQKFTNRRSNIERLSADVLTGFFKIKLASVANTPVAKDAYANKNASFLPEKLSGEDTTFLNRLLARGLNPDIFGSNGQVNLSRVTGSLSTLVNGGKRSSDSMGGGGGGKRRRTAAGSGGNLNTLSDDAIAIYNMDLGQKSTWTDCARQNIPLPVSFLHFRMNIRLETGCVIFLRDGGETGVVLVRDASVQFTRDNSSFMLHVEARFDVTTIIVRYQNLQLMPDTYNLRYLGGAGTEFYVAGQTEDEYGDEMDVKSMHAVAVPYDFEPAQYYTDTTGNVSHSVLAVDSHSAMNIAANGASQYPTSQFYSQLGVGHGFGAVADARFFEAGLDREAENAPTTLAIQACQRVYNPKDNATTLEILGHDAFGSSATPLTYNALLTSQAEPNLLAQVHA